jgi:hypothetical protein
MSFFLTKRLTTIPPEHIEEYGQDIIPSFIPYHYSTDRISNMKYVVATSDTPYFRWQMLVQINNFKRLGILDDLTYVVSIRSRRSAKLNHIQKETGVKIFTYKDERIGSKYSSSIRPHILKKHFTKFPDDSKMFYYLDPDVLFREKPEYSDYIYLTPDWFVSDTKSYLNTRYIKSKGEELFKLMCKSINIDTELVENMDSGAGGAQYIMKNADADYWDNVEKDSETLYELMTSTSHKYNPEHPIQAWTADMWAVIWNAWKLGHITIVWDDMKFSWATDNINAYEKSNIFHNAGVFDQTDLFNKTHYIEKHPFDDDFSYVDSNRGSIKYVEEILDTKKNFSKLIKKL